jgi:hypothetical protein
MLRQVNCNIRWCVGKHAGGWGGSSEPFGASVTSCHRLKELNCPARGTDWQRLVCAFSTSSEFPCAFCFVNPPRVPCLFLGLRYCKGTSFAVNFLSSPCVPFHLAPKRTKIADKGKGGKQRITMWFNQPRRNPCLCWSLTL